MLHGKFDLDGFSGSAYELVAQMESQQLIPTVAVRYLRDAYVYPGTDLRLTFDTELEAIEPDPQALFSAAFSGVPVLDRNSIIMEIKYGSHLPAFLRKLTDVSCESFIPKPQIDSTVVKLTSKENKIPDDDFKTYSKFTKALFQHRNKKIRNALIDSRHIISGIDKKVLKRNLNEIEDERLIEYLKKRVVVLEPEEILFISRELKPAFEE